MLDRTEITRSGRQGETASLRALHEQLELSAPFRSRILREARDLVKQTREHSRERTFLDKFLAEYGLSSDAGVALMCICEALLRIPDAVTADALLREKLTSANWHEHLGGSDSIFLNASTWALLLTGKTFELAPEITANVRDWITKLVANIGESTARTAMAHAVQILGSEFVFGRTINEALSKTDSTDNSYSFDMLGEGARTHAAAQDYFDSYANALERIAESNRIAKRKSGMSVKLSALHPRYEPLQRKKVVAELGERLLVLAGRAAALDVQVSIDAEEAVRLELSLDLFEFLARSKLLNGWEGLGFVVQGYSKRAPAVIDWLETVACETNRRALPVRLVKGAYWDAEIKYAQVEGLQGFPVFTRKPSTDLAWIVALQKLFACECLYPQVATHNAYSIAAAMNFSEGKAFEFQRLHGMGELLYAQSRTYYKDRFPTVRIYAPVGDHRNLLSYLVRRLLENGANASFVNRLLDATQPVETVVQDPIKQVEEYEFQCNPKIQLPTALFGEQRANSAGIDLGDRAQVTELWEAVNTSEFVVCRDLPTEPAEVETAFTQAENAYVTWSQTPLTYRRDLLNRTADLLESNIAELIRRLRDEAGKTFIDCVAEVREAVDFCRYYGAESVNSLSSKLLVGPTGERNTLQYCGRGVFVCISPWNFPLAIFLGQIVAALAAGNTVVAKPAEQTPQIASLVIKLLTTAGLPPGCVSLVYGGAAVGKMLIRHANTAGVAFTGSLDAAKNIQRELAAKSGPIVPLIAETGGINVMVVDSTVLFEQTIDDVLASAFRSAGQRCSALRLLCIQEEIADALLLELARAADSLNVCDPRDLSTDIGPLIDQAAKNRIENYLNQNSDAIYYQGKLDEHYATTHIAPTILMVDSVSQVSEEIFGPILHVYRYAQHSWVETLEAVRDAGFALTFGVQTRIESRAREAARIVGAGNVYVNRDMIEATVGVQPFGGHGLSGTGPKAGGPNYLLRFAREEVFTENIVATGGNHELLRLD